MHVLCCRTAAGLCISIANNYVAYIENISETYLEYMPLMWTRVGQMWQPECVLTALTASQIALCGIAMS